MRKLIALGLAFTALVLLNGCHHSGVDGTWKPKGTTSEGMSLSITGGTFEMTMLGQTIKGTATQADRTVTLTPSEVDGKPPASEEDKKPITLTLSEDGKTLSGKDGLISLDKQ